jgi:hypothetical protein
MQTPSTSICSAASAAVALIPGLLQHLPVQRFRMANSSEELLDLFEEKYGVFQGQAQQRVAISLTSLDLRPRGSRR